MFGSHGGNAKTRDQKKMRIMQQNLNHCEPAQDLLRKTVTEVKQDLLLISEPYGKPENSQWVFEATGKLPFGPATTSRSRIPSIA